MGLRDRSTRVLHEPLLHFLVLGAALYGIYALLGPVGSGGGADRITVTRGEIEWLVSSWEKRWNRPPTPRERAGLIDEYVRETILYREALALGLDRDDTIVRRRLAQKLEFLVQDLAAAEPPTEEELATYLAAHQERYTAPAVATFTHRFVDPDERGDEALPHAEALLAELRAQGPPTDASALGDRLMLRPSYQGLPEPEISKLFGSEFARELMQLDPGRWHGPVSSGYGLHLVFVEARRDPVPPTLADVRERVQHDWEEERRRALNEEYAERLRARYEIVIEDEDAEDDYASVSEETR